MYVELEADKATGRPIGTARLLSESEKNGDGSAVGVKLRGDSLKIAPLTAANHEKSVLLN